MDAAGSHAVPQRLLARVRSVRLIVVAGVAAVLAVAAFQLWLDPNNPPGFLPDEASMSYNAYLLAHHLRDENGGLLPLYIVSFGDFKSPLFTYTLAAVFRVTGPHSEVARGLAAVGMLVAVLLLGLFVRRRTGSSSVAVAVVVLAGLTPMLFEAARAAYEVALEPLMICLFLFAVEAAWRRQAWTVRRGILAGLGLTGIAFVYAAGRLLAPLFALALLTFLTRQRIRWLAAAWATFAVTAVGPIASYWFRHPKALTQRYDQTTFITSDMSPWTIVSKTVSHYIHDMNLWRWIVSGDPKPYVHTWGAGSIFASVVLLAAASIVVAVYRWRADRFWLFTLVLLLLCPIPAALTKDRYYALRLVPLPVMLLIVGIPALTWLLTRVRVRWSARLAATALVALVGVQFVHFVDNFRNKGPERTTVYHSGVRKLLADGFANGGVIHVNHDEPHALVYAKWYAVEHGIPLSRVDHVVAGEVPVPGAIILGRFQPCDYVCIKTEKEVDYWLGRSGGPLGGEHDVKSAPPTLVVKTTAGSKLKVSFLASGHVVTGASAWGYYLRVRKNGKPWNGAISIEVRDGKGKVVDGVGRYFFKGSYLGGYYWNTADEGMLLHFVITLLDSNGNPTGTIDYGVAVRHRYVQ
jgi:hypothetical protein